MKKKIYFSMLSIGLLGVFAAVLPAVLIFWRSGGLAPFIFFALLASALLAVAAYFAAKWLTSKIIGPINGFSLSDDENYPFEELIPFLSAASRQKNHLKEQIALLEERASATQAIMENMREGLILLGADGTILSSNASAMRLFGASPAEYLNRNILELSRRPEFLEKVRSALSGKAADDLMEFDSRIIQVFFSPSTHNESVNGAILLFLDITERAGAERIRREFTANVSHELKTPLTVISGLSEMLALGMAKKEDMRKFAAKIKIETDRMAAIVEDILKLSELDEKADSKQFEKFSLYELAQTTAAGLSSLAGDKSVEVEISGGAFEVNANKKLLLELFHNLIENAIKYNVENGKVSVILSKSGEEVKIEVSDTGIGIPKEHIPRIFERFYRVDPSRSKKTGGTGLGLSIVKHAAQYHGGAVSIDSVSGEGSTVTVTLKIQ